MIFVKLEEICATFADFRGTSIFTKTCAFCLMIVFIFPLEAHTGKNSAQNIVPYKVIHVYPHDSSAYTQGLFYLDGYLYEGTGREGFSSIRMMQVETGNVLQRHDLPAEYFGEGITDWGSNLLELTWKSHICFVYDRISFRLVRTFHYEGEGWGLTHDRKHLIMSDGTSKLRFLDPNSFKEIKRLTVTYKGKPVVNLNELEYIHGKVFANIWMSDRIAIISPKTGRVVNWIDLSHIFPGRDSSNMNAVLNGIAYDESGDRIFITGKLWAKLFEIKLAPSQNKH